MKFSLYSKFQVRSLIASQNAYAHFFSASFSSTARDSLYKRISPLGDPNISITPVLDQWVQEGKTVAKTELQGIIKELRVYKRFKHALEISHWMSDKRYIPLSHSDLGVRLILISRVHGLDQVEKYFNHIPLQLKGFEVYIALLKCYVNEMAVVKAERTFQKMKEMGLVRTATAYNLLMNLYCQVGDHEKLDTLMFQMEETGIPFDQYTFANRLTAYVAVTDIDGMDKIVQRMESNLGSVLDWSAYSIAADGYLKVGLIDKALQMLKKLEKQIIPKRRHAAFDLLLKFYARAGKKDELYRIWKHYKKKERIYNKGYMSMISSLLMLNDIEGAEKIFEQWQSRKLSYDFRIPNLLITAYCRKDLAEKAESLVNSAIAKGHEPSVDVWYSLANGYLEGNQIPKAKEYMKKAILVCPPEWKPSRKTLATCLEYMEGKGGAEQVEEVMKLLRIEGIFSPIARDRLLTYIKDGNSQSVTHV